MMFPFPERINQAPCVMLITLGFIYHGSSDTVIFLTETNTWRLDLPSLPVMILPKFVDLKDA